MFLARGRSAPALSKASPDDPKHPGWPAGTSGGLGGKFRPKDGAKEKGKAAVEGLSRRRAIRALMLQTLSLPFEALANLVPGLGEAADVVAVAQLARTTAELRQLNIDTNAALDFIERGPHSLESLRVTSDFAAFPSYGAFYKGLSLVEIIALRFGAAGPGYQDHHIVEQGGTNGSAFPIQDLQNTENIIRIPTLLHEAVSGVYSKKSEKTGDLTLRFWLQTRDLAEQREEGIEVLKSLGIVKR